MGRATAISLLTIALSAAPASAATVVKLPARVQLSECRASTDQSKRTAVFKGRMSSIPATSRMQMRFRLQMRSEESDGWGTVDAEGWDEWTSADPGVRKYVYTKQLANLPAPAAYRVQVRFRWLDAGGESLISKRLTSSVCRQPDLRPNLLVGDIAIEPAVDPTNRHYLVAVRNSGGSTTSPFDLVLMINGIEHRTQVSALRAEERRLVEVVAPRCDPGTTVAARLDTAGAIAERDEGDNAFTRFCPLAQ